MKRSELKPGMRVKNKVSGNLAKVLDDGKGKLRYTHKDFVAVRLRPNDKATWQYPLWRVSNLERTKWLVHFK